MFCTRYVEVQEKIRELRHSDALSGLNKDHPYSLPDQKELHERLTTVWCKNCCLFYGVLLKFFFEKVLEKEKKKSETIKGLRLDLLSLRRKVRPSFF